VRLEHPGLVRQGLAQDAEHGLELVPVHRVAHEQQPLAAQPMQEVRRVEPTGLARGSAAFWAGGIGYCGTVGVRAGEWVGWYLVGTWGGCSGAAPSATACTWSPVGRSPRTRTPRPRRGTFPEGKAAAPPRPAPTPRRTRRTFSFQFHPLSRPSPWTRAVAERKNAVGEVDAALVSIVKVEKAAPVSAAAAAANAAPVSSVAMGAPTRQGETAGVGKVKVTYVSLAARARMVVTVIVTEQVAAKPS
jgi:hypothetical protein